MTSDSGTRQKAMTSADFCTCSNSRWARWATSCSSSGLSSKMVVWALPKLKNRSLSPTRTRKSPWLRPCGRPKLEIQCQLKIRCMSPASARNLLYEPGLSSKQKVRVRSWPSASLILGWKQAGLELASSQTRKGFSQLALAHNSHFSSPKCMKIGN